MQTQPAEHAPKVQKPRLSSSRVIVLKARVFPQTHLSVSISQLSLQNGRSRSSQTALMWGEVASDDGENRRQHVSIAEVGSRRPKKTRLRLPSAG